MPELVTAQGRAYTAMGAPVLETIAVEYTDDVYRVTHAIATYISGYRVDLHYNRTDHAILSSALHDFKLITTDLTVHNYR